MRINTRLSPHAQVQFRVPERRSLGTRLILVPLNQPMLVRYSEPLEEHFQSTPTGVVMAHTKWLVAKTQFAGAATRSTSVLAIHAEKTYKEIQLVDQPVFIDVYYLSSAPMLELQ